MKLFIALLSIGLATLLIAFSGKPNPKRKDATDHNNHGGEFISDHDQE